MNFEEAELEISEFLSGKINEQNVEVVPLPEVEKDFEKAWGKLKVIVAFASEDADVNSFTTSGVYQDVTITFSILIQGKSLRGPNGLYQLAEKIKRVLVGYQPKDGDAMTYGGHKFLDRNNGVFEYGLDFKTRSVRMQNFEEETGPPFIGGITIN